MTESEFNALWQTDKPSYEAWGEFVISEITGALVSEGLDISSFFKILPKSRLKDDRSIIDKAFYRGKNYENPYVDIEDKVGVRFVVLLLDDIQKVTKVIEANSYWSFDPCKHFDEDREREPLLFTYQSVHYILRPKEKFVFNKINIDTSVSCEVQIRTLLQHAHAELTHDAIYKSKKKIKASVHRTVAKSMALIETTDDFFRDVTHTLNEGPIKEFRIIESLDSIYLHNTKLNPINQKSSIIIWDEFEDLINGELIDKIQRFLKRESEIFEIIKIKYGGNVLYQQSTVLFIFWMLRTKRIRLLADWPYSREMLAPLASDIGVSISPD